MIFETSTSDTSKDLDVLTSKSHNNRSIYAGFVLQIRPLGYVPMLMVLHNKR